MKKNFLKYLALLFITAAFFPPYSAGLNTDGQTESPDYNEVLRQAVLRTLEGEDITLDQFKGKTVLIDFWETWCTPCLRSMPTYQKLLEEYPDDFVVLAVSPGYMDSPEQVRQFADSNDYDFVFLFGEALAQSFQIQSIPFKVYVSPEGAYVTSIMGSRGPQEDYNKAREIIEKFH